MVLCHFHVGYLQLCEDEVESRCQFFFILVCFVPSLLSRAAGSVILATRLNMCNLRLSYQICLMSPRQDVL